MNDHPTRTEQQPEDLRVRFAAERTLLAWMRTGLALMGFGFVVARFGLFLREIAAASQVAAHQHSTGWSLWIGTALIGLPPCPSPRRPTSRQVLMGQALKRTTDSFVAVSSSWGRIPFSPHHRCR